MSEQSQPLEKRIATLIKATWEEEIRLALDEGRCVRNKSRMCPNAYFIMIVIGAVKGNGPAFFKFGEKLIKVVWTTETIKFLRPAFSTKLMDSRPISAIRWRWRSSSRGTSN